MYIEAKLQSPHQYRAIDLQWGCNEPAGVNRSIERQRGEQQCAWRREGGMQQLRGDTYAALEKRLE